MARGISTTVNLLRLWRLAWGTGMLFISTLAPSFAAEATGQVASHGLERDAVNADGTGEGAGYFTIAFNTNPAPINNSFPLIFCLGFTSFAIGSDAGPN